MKYIANPVEVEALRIVSVANPVPGVSHGFTLGLENGSDALATPEMCSRMTPQIGDYWVIQSDGYVYLNPREVFERKYSPKFQSPGSEDGVVRPGDPYFGHIYPADKPVVEGLEKHEEVYAKNQSQYLPLRSLRDNVDECHSVISRWSPNVEQRQGIALGADIFLELLTFGNPLQPIAMFVADKPNPEHFRTMLHLETQEEMWRRTGKTIASVIKGSNGKKTE